MIPSIASRKIQHAVDKALYALQGAQDRWPRKFEFPPKMGLGTALFLADRSQGQKNPAVGQI